MRALATLLTVAASVPMTGCCNLARYLCGPDETEWVSERFDTPRAAVETFREALRRADAQAVHRSFSEDLKQRTGLTGSIQAELVWRRIESDFPAVHVLGYAEILDLEAVGPAVQRARLRASGREIELRLVRQPYWEVRWIYGGDPEQIEREGRYVRSLDGFASLEVDAGYALRATARLPPLDVEIPDLEDLQFVGVGAEWKIDAIDEVRVGG
jgi:hypothetical protein